VSGVVAPPRLDGPTRVTAFGARFVDPATGRAIRDGLRVTLFPKTRPELARDAYLTAGGVHALQRAPGLGDFDRGDGGARFWHDALAAPVDFIVEVRDALGRYHDIAMALTLPTPGPFGSGPSASGLPAPVALPITPARMPPPATAVLHADLRDARSPGQPLRHAMLVVVCGGVEVGFGIADLDGRIAVMFSYPEPTADAPFSWPLALTLYCARPTTGLVDPQGPSDLPDLKTLLAQRQGTAWRLLGTWDADQSSGTDYAAPPLKLGRPLTLDTTHWHSLLAIPA
jgi:hypothetical protein